MTADRTMSGSSLSRRGGGATRGQLVLSHHTEPFHLKTLTCGCSDGAYEHGRNPKGGDENRGGVAAQLGRGGGRGRQRPLVEVLEAEVSDALEERDISPPGSHSSHVSVSRSKIKVIHENNLSCREKSCEIV